MDQKVLENSLEKIMPEGYSGEEEDPGWTMAIISHISVYLYPIILLAALYVSMKNLYEVNFLLITLPSFIISWIGGDIVTGLVHWFCDTYGTVNTPIIGHSLIRNFRSHHTYPKDLCISPFIYTVGHVEIVSLITLQQLIYLMTKFPHSIILSTFTFTYTVITFLTLMTNQFHKWAHLETEKVPGYVKILQKNKVILDPEHHQTHHSRPFNSNYCITHGLANPFLEKIKFFRTVEKILLRFGLKSTV